MSKAILTEEEWIRLKEVLPAKFKLLFECLNSSGLRIDELLSLRVKDLTFKGEAKGRIFVRDGKGGQPGEASFKTDEITDMVAAHVKKL
jgi:integrase